MLNQYTTNSSRPRHESSIPLIIRSGIPLPPHRRRGGQLGNSNAFRHGLYSAHSQHTRVTPLKRPSIHKDPGIQQKELEDRIIASGKKELRECRYRLANGLAASKGSLPFKDILCQVRAATILVGKIQKITQGLLKLEDRRSYLQTLVRDLPALLRWEFSEMGMPVPSVFVPHKLVNPHANLDWEAPQLTDDQWELLQDIFVSQRADIDYFRKYRRRKPLPSDRFLFEGIFWKLANGLHWRDLAGKYPVRRCQELYCALVRSGRMQTVYNRLRGHLDIYGNFTLKALVESGCFVLAGNRILLAPSEKPTWEKYTAMLLLQKGNHARRSIRLGMDRERRRLGRVYRLPSRGCPNSTCRSTHNYSRPLHPLEPAWPVSEKNKIHQSELSLEHTSGSSDNTQNCPSYSANFHSVPNRGGSFP